MSLTDTDRPTDQPDVDDCVFCDIAEGRSPATIIATWTDAIAFAPLNPVTPGHALVIPRRHVADALVDPDVAAFTFRRAAELAAGLRGLGVDMNLITSAGEHATQTVFHLHIHVVPRRPGDGLHLPWTGQHR